MSLPYFLYREKKCKERKKLHASCRHKRERTVHREKCHESRALPLDHVPSKLLRLDSKINWRLILPLFLIKKLISEIKHMRMHAVATWHLYYGDRDLL